MEKPVGRKTRLLSFWDLRVCLAGLVMTFVLSTSVLAENQPLATKNLFNAVWRNDLVGVKSSIMAGADISAINAMGSRPVDMAVDRGHFEIAHYLLSVDKQRSEMKNSGVDETFRGSAAVLEPNSNTVPSPSGSVSLLDTVSSASTSSTSERPSAPTTPLKSAMNSPVSSSPVQEKLWSPDSESITTAGTLKIIGVAKPKQSVPPSRVPTDKEVVAKSEVAKSELAETPLLSASASEQPKMEKKGWLGRVAGLFTPTEKGAVSSIPELSTGRKSETAILEGRGEPSSVAVSKTLISIERPANPPFEDEKYDETNLAIREEQVGEKSPGVSKYPEMDSSQAIQSSTEVKTGDEIKESKGEKFFSRIAKLFGTPEADPNISTQLKSEVTEIAEINRSPAPLIDTQKQTVTEPGVLSSKVPSPSKPNLSVLDVKPITEEASFKANEVKPALEERDEVRRIASLPETSYSDRAVDPGSKLSSNEAGQVVQFRDNLKLVSKDLPVGASKSIESPADLQTPSRQEPELPGSSPPELEFKSSEPSFEKNNLKAQSGPTKPGARPSNKEKLWRPINGNKDNFSKKEDSITIPYADIDTPTKFVAADPPENDETPSPFIEKYEGLEPETAGLLLRTFKPSDLDLGKTDEEAIEPPPGVSEIKPTPDTNANILSRLANLYSPVLEVRAGGEEASLKTNLVKPTLRDKQSVKRISATPETSAQGLTIDSGSGLNEEGARELAQRPKSLERLATDKVVNTIATLDLSVNTEYQFSGSLKSRGDKLQAATTKVDFKETAFKSPADTESPKLPPPDKRKLWSPDGGKAAVIPNLRVINAAEPQKTATRAVSLRGDDIPTKFVMSEIPEANEPSATTNLLRVKSTAPPDSTSPIDDAKELPLPSGAEPLDKSSQAEVASEISVISTNSLVAETPEKNEPPALSVVSQANVPRAANISRERQISAFVKSKIQEKSFLAEDQRKNSVSSAGIMPPRPGPDIAALPEEVTRAKRKKVLMPRFRSMGANAVRIPQSVDSRPPLINTRLWLTETKDLGRRAPRTGDIPCIDKSQWNSVYCIEPVRWPSRLMQAFKINSKFYRGQNSIIEYVAGRSVQIHVLFRTGELRRISEYFKNKFGAPTERSEILTALIGQPKRSNRTLRWRSRDLKTGDITVLEIREIDDLRWSSPPDVKHGALRLYTESRGSVFEFLTSTDLLMAKLRRRK